MILKDLDCLCLLVPPWQVSCLRVWTPSTPSQRSGVRYRRRYGRPQRSIRIASQRYCCTRPISNSLKCEASRLPVCSRPACDPNAYVGCAPSNCAVSCVTCGAVESVAASMSSAIGSRRRRPPRHPSHVQSFRSDRSCRPTQRIKGGRRNRWAQQWRRRCPRIVIDVSMECACFHQVL